MEISQVNKDYRIYIEDAVKNYIHTDFILEAEKGLGKVISCKVSLISYKEPFTLKLTRSQIYSLSALLLELGKKLKEEDELGEV